MECPSGGRLRLTCEKYGPHKKYTKLVLLEHETLLLTKCAKPFEEKTFVEALGAKGQVRSLGPEELEKKFLFNTIGATQAKKKSLIGLSKKAKPFSRDYMRPLSKK